MDIGDENDRKYFAREYEAEAMRREERIRSPESTFQDTGRSAFKRIRALRMSRLL